jgi:hypothetical protein
MFDRALLPPARCEVVVLADSHLMLAGSAGGEEFASRALQTARGERAFALIAALIAERPRTTVVHLGDLVQAFPGGPDFERAVDAAEAQLARSGLSPRLVAGNHDVGDKPDPTSPADWVSAESLVAYHRRFGPSWYSWDEAGLHFIVLNSQILNSAQPEVEEQARWLEANLSAHRDQPAYLFLHLAPFLVDPGEPDLGHYDNVAEPARRWLLELCRRFRVDTVFAAHSHYLFCNRIGRTRFFVTPSVAFTRPGFGEIFSSAPPDQRGRNDVAKLGFYLVRVQDEGTRVHFVRTGGDTAPVNPDSLDLILLTRLSGDLPRSPLGVVARHPLAAIGEVPIAWPSVVRQPMRNDFPLLACLELGARHLRLPLLDLEDPIQRERLALLRDEGVQITAAWLWSPRHPFASRLARHQDVIDVVEVQVPGTLFPPEECLEQMRRTAAESRIPLALAPVLAREIVAGKQHPRTRVGYCPSELAELGDYLSQHGMSLNRVVCRADSSLPPWESLRLTRGLSTSGHIGGIDWVVDLVSGHELERQNRTAEAVFASALLSGTRVFLDPLIDLDRTMDATEGLLDRLCNPRPTFHVARCLNSLLFSQPGEGLEPVASPPVSGVRILAARGARTTAWLFLPERSGQPLTLDAPELVGAGAREGHWYDLTKGTSRLIDLTVARRAIEELSGPALLVVERQSANYEGGT